MEKQYVMSERAHFMCPNMHFGILFTIGMAKNMQKIRNCLDSMAQAHPFLRSVLNYEQGTTKLYYKIDNESKVEITERESVQTIWADYKKIASMEWDVFHNGLLKVFIYPVEEGMKLLFVAHHLLGDGRCLLELVNEFVDFYLDEVKPVYTPERLIRGLEDLPDNSELTGVSKYLVRRLNSKWRAEKKSVSYETYASFANQFVKENPVSYETIGIDQKKFYDIKKDCDANDITINDLFMSQAYDVMNTKKIVIAADIRSKLSCYCKGACGNYATAIGIMCKRKQTDVLERAKEVHRQVKSHMKCNPKLMLVLSCYLSMEPGLIDATAIATLGNFESKAARFVGSNMFGFLKRDGVSITNLGSVNNKHISEAIFIPPASPAMTQTIGILTLNDNIQLCCSYYQNSISNEKVKNRLTKLIEI